MKSQDRKTAGPRGGSCVGCKYLSIADLGAFCTEPSTAKLEDEAHVDPKGKPLYEPRYIGDGLVTPAWCAFVVKT